MFAYTSCFYGFMGILDQSQNWLKNEFYNCTKRTSIHPSKLNSTVALSEDDSSTEIWPNIEYNILQPEDDFLEFRICLIVKLGNLISDFIITVRDLIVMYDVHAGVTLTDISN